MFNLGLFELLILIGFLLGIVAVVAVVVYLLLKG